MNSNDKWNVYKNSTFPQRYPFDCCNTVESTCYKTTLDKCVRLCQSSQSCNFGYYKSDGFCAPLDTDNFSDVNPYDHIIYDPSGTVFINNNVFTQQSLSNVVRYSDNIYLKNVESGLFLQAGIENEQVVLSPIESELNIQYKNISVPRSFVKFGDELTFGILNSPLILTQRFSNMIWSNITPYGMLQLPLFTFEQINSTNHTNNVRYGDRFHIKSLGSYVTLIRQGNSSILNLDYSPIESLTNATFELVPSRNIKGYYCDNSKCVSIPLHQTKFNEDNRYYNDKDIMRSSNCYLKCH
jgi:hypothetical protein